MKRWISIIAAVLLICSCAVLPASSAEGGYVIKYVDYYSSAGSRAKAGYNSEKVTLSSSIFYAAARYEMENEHDFDYNCAYGDFTENCGVVPRTKSVAIDFNIRAVFIEYVGGGDVFFTQAELSDGNDFIVEMMPYDSFIAMFDYYVYP